MKQPTTQPTWERYCYYALVALRVAFAFLATGYIHPDEYFQNGEITAGSIFSWHTLRTWEWQPLFPCRSIVPPFLTTGLPFIAIKRLFYTTPLSLFITQRLSFLAQSFCLDYAILKLVPTFTGKARLLLASSHVLMTFQLRPFSNSLEATILVLSMVCLYQFISSARGRSHYLSSSLKCVAVLTVFGAFTRITYIAFGLPVVAQTLLKCKDLLVTSSKVSRPLLLKQLFGTSLVTVIFLLGAVAADSYYFRSSMKDVVLTPYNNLVYNMSPANLAEHGIHPRWLHICVNLPLMVGPGLVVYGILAARQLWSTSWNSNKAQASPFQVINRTCALVIGASLFLLSLQPHQEPRFLVPLVVPFIVLVANTGYLQTAGRLFWSTWIVGNILISLLFGVLHQGGVVPSLLHVSHLVSSTNIGTTSAIIYWKTYMPPRHLLGIQEHDITSQHVTFHDLAGGPPLALEAAVLALPHNHVKNTTIYLVTPQFALRSLNPRVSGCFALEKSIFPHLDLDHISQSLEIGWPHGLSLGVHVGDLACLQQ